MIQIKNIATNLISIDFIKARSMRRAQQTQDILEAMAKNDFDELKRLARCPEGFVDDKLRKYVW